MKWLKALFAIVVLLCVSLGAYPALAFEGRGGEKVVIEEGETIVDDLFVSARAFVLKGKVTGDLIVFAQAVIIEETGVVEGDLYAAAQIIEIKGKVLDDIVATGYAISITGEGGSDFIGAGFSTEVSGYLGRDFLFFGYQALINGNVVRNLKFAGNGIKISGWIGGDAEIDVSEAEEGLPPGFPFYSGLPRVPYVPPGLKIQEGARIGGNLRYTAREEFPVPAGVVGGKVEFKKYEAPKKVTPPPHVRALRWGLDRLRYLASLLLVGTIMLLVAPKWTQRMAETVRAKPLPGLGWGVVVLVAFGLVMVVLAVVTVVISLILNLLTIKGLAGWSFFTGLVAGAMGLWGMGLAWIYVTRVLTGIALGTAIFQAFKSKAAASKWWPFILGVVVLVLVTSIPTLGRILGWAASLAGLGSFWFWVRAEPEGIAPSSSNIS